jgi:GC-rich sequence DNA-binding factor
MLLKSVAGCFQAAISSTEESIVKYTQTQGQQSRVAGFNPDAIPARRRFLNRRLKLVKNLLRWRKYTGERFGLGGMLARLIEHSIVPIAESGWEVGGEDIVRKVSEHMIRQRFVVLSIMLADFLPFSLDG